jgi:hypothetical protein
MSKVRATARFAGRAGNARPAAAPAHPLTLAVADGGAEGFGTPKPPYSEKLTRSGRSARQRRLAGPASFAISHLSGDGVSAAAPLPPRVSAQASGVNNPLL